MVLHLCSYFFGQNLRSIYTTRYSSRLLTQSSIYARNSLPSEASTSNNSHNRRTTRTTPTHIPTRRNLAVAESTMDAIFDSLLILFPIMFFLVYLKNLAVETVLAAYNAMVQFLEKCRRAMAWSLYFMLFIFTFACVNVFFGSMKAVLDGEKIPRHVYYNY